MSKTKTAAPTVESLQVRLDSMYSEKPGLSWDSFMENADDLYPTNSVAWFQEVIGEAMDAAE